MRYSRNGLYYKRKGKKRESFIRKDKRIDVTTIFLLILLAVVIIIFLIK